MKVKKKKKSYKTSNLPPGTIAYKGFKKSTVTAIEIVNYSKEHYTRFKTNSELSFYRNQKEEVE